MKQVWNNIINNSETLNSFICREIDPMNGTEQFTLVGIVNGNPRGCRDKRLFPDFHASVGNEEVEDVQICFDSLKIRFLKIFHF